ncbi:MAG: DegT/DnrJ/EryC1/StrS family aminotransferase [Gammaproteobacteria bacterium]|nr:DegT/DnrJ/EryC1/StrS family aminotransferase [Gammaproteobacteria bacterium]MDH4254092.1 DegT/DnrJ/EryC1/StrS family aminotransferase [Gammaproteobacteria bacterium]MDH5309636.1 DegT/DnrJ/EryC1/StrS family aminotransferase [Gammaproteobacteria bacterium]
MSASSDEPFIIFGAPDIREAEIAEAEAVLRSGWIGTGPKVAKFERDFATRKGLDASNVAAVNSCTAALHVSMIAAGLGSGDEVITTAMTFCATANAIIHAGATPVLVDIDPGTLNIDTVQLEASISDRTRAIVPVHFAGRPCDMGAIMKIANRHGLAVIEDCAHAIETKWHGQTAGTFGDFGCFSFYVTKNVTTGEGGMVAARSRDAIDRIKVLALHGMSKDAWHRFGDAGYKHYQVVEAGFKYNMMDLQAALGIHQLQRLEENWQRRRQIWDSYQEALADLPVGRPAEPEPDTVHAFHLYTLRIDRSKAGMERDEFIERMTAAGIGLGVHYLSLAQHPHYQQRFGWRPENWPIAYEFGRQTVSLPLSPKLSEPDVNRIIRSVRRVIRG